MALTGFHSAPMAMLGPPHETRSHATHRASVIARPRILGRAVAGCRLTRNALGRSPHVDLLVRMASGRNQFSSASGSFSSERCINER